jgi:hypothetical protein
LML